MADDGNRSSFAFIGVGLRERTAEHGVDAQHGEEVRIDEQPVERDRIVFGLKDELVPTPRGQIVEGAIPLAPIEEDTG